MKHNSKLMKAIFMSVFFLIGGSVLTYAQEDQTNGELQDEVSDSLDFFDDGGIILSDAVIVGRGVIDLEEDRKTPVATSTILKQEIQDKAVGNVEFPEIMKNTPSVYVANQTGGFGDSQMFLRGFDQTNTAFLLNGQPINGMEDGNMYWSNWSSMTDVANAVQVQRGLGSSKLAISSVGGTVNIVTKATEKNQGGMARLVMGNDSYMKGTVAYDSGLQGKWGYSILIDYWQAHRKYAMGTQGKGQSYFVSIGYKPNDHHNFNFMIFGAPQAHFQNYSKSMEKYEQFGEKYNDNYGYYKGHGFSTRENYYHKPVANLNWDWNINSNASLSTVLYASLGRGGGTGPLGNGADYIDGGRDKNGYINFDQIELENASIEGGIGQGFTGSAQRASVNNHFWYGLVSNFNYDTKNNWAFNVGADLRFYKGDHFRQLVELFGLQGWRDTGNVNFGNDHVVSNTFKADPWSSLFNFAKREDRIAYDYSEWINYQGLFGQVEYNIGGFSAFVQGAASNQSYVGENYYEYEGSKKSEKVNKFGYNVKGGLAYNFDDHTFFGNAGHYSRQPYKDNILSDDNTEIRTPEVGNEEITGFELGYTYRTGKIRLNINLYHTTWGNRFLSTFGRLDLPVDGDIQQVDVNYLFYNIKQVHQGVEIDLDAKISREWSVRGYTSLGKWTYDGSSRYDVRRDDTYEIVPELAGEQDFSGLYIGNAPQFSFGTGAKWRPARGLYFDADFNYYARLWGQLDVSSATSGKQSEELSPYATIDAGVTYEFKFGNTGQSVRFRGNVYNLLNSSFQARKDGYGYFLGEGRTFNVAIQYNF